MVCMGFALMWWTIKPDAVQVFGMGIGTVGDTSQSLTKTNTEGSLAHRVEMATYGLRAGMEYLPFGTGIGTTRNIYPGLKEQSGINVSDLHNYYIQTFAEVGPIGLLALIGIILSALAIAWRRKKWYLFSAIFLMAGYLAFDVPAYYPALMIGFFGLMGAASAPESPLQVTDSGSVARATRVLLIGLAIVAPLYWWSWLLPCDDTSCAIDRKLAVRETVDHVYRLVDGEDRRVLVEQAIELNPVSHWAYEHSTHQSRDDEDAESYLETAIAVAKDFPVATSRVYADWYHAAHLAENPEEAQRALDTGTLHYDAELITEWVDNEGINHLIPIGNDHD